MKSAAYSNTKKNILDSIRCVKGKPCGEICIPKKSECSVGKTSLKTPGKNSHVGQVVAGGSIGSTLGAATLAAGLGVMGVAKLHEIRDNYQANFVTSAIRAEVESRAMKVPKLNKDVNTVILSVGGFGTKDAYSESVALKDNIESLGLKGLHVEPQSYAEFNVPTKPHNRATTRQAAKEAKDLFIKTVVKTGYNPVAVTVAARLMAYKKANPDKEYQLMGHSGGGLVVQEVHEILNKANIKLKTTAIGSPDVGLIPGTGDLVTTTSKHDRILKLSKGRGVNGKAFDNVTDHAQNAYFADKDFRDFIKQRLTPSRKDRFDKAICKIGKNCGDICIPKSSKCKSGSLSLASSQAKNKAIISALKSPELAVAGVAARLLATVAVTGLPVGVAIAVRQRYRAGLPESIRMAKEKAQAIDPAKLQDFSDKDQLTFFQSGFTAGGGKVREAAYVKESGNLLRKEFPSHGVVERFNKGFNITPIVPDPDPRLSPSDPGFYAPATPAYLAKFLSKAVSKTVGTFFVEGRNPEAVNLASEVYAYHQKYPQKPLNIIGHSAGGIIAPEAANILKGMGVKSPIKVVTIGAPDFGIIDYPEQKSYASKSDPITGIFPNKKAKFQNEVKTHNYADYLLNPVIKKEVSEFFNSKKNQVKTDSKSKSTKFKITYKRDSLTANTLQQIQKNFSVLLSRAYGKAIAKIGGLKISLDNTVTGMAQDVTGKVLSFTFKDEKLTYELAKKSAKMDSAELWGGLITNYREDKKTVKKKCGKGIACGDTCIAANDTCRLKINQIATPLEVSRLKQSIIKFKLEQNQNTAPVVIVSNDVPIVQGSTEVKPIQSKYIADPKTGTPYTIRELRKQAAEKRIYGYGSMTIKELQASLQLYDEKPESRNRIVSGVAKRKGFSTRAITASGLSGRGTLVERVAKRSLKDTTDTWRKLEALAKFAGSSPVGWSAAAVGAFLFGATIRSYERSRQIYRDGFDESAKIAEERAAKIDLQHPVENAGEPVLLPNGQPRMSSRIMQDNITFAVGSGKGYGAEQMKAVLQKEKDPNNKKDYWFAQSNYVIPFNLREFGTPPGRDGSEPSTASTVIDGIGGVVRNFSRRRNQDAVDLAAQIYAHAIAVSQTDGKTRLNKDKKINILAHSSGGLVAKEAMEILSRMELKGSPSGKKVLEQVNAVYLGTPHFGFAENVSRRQRTIVSPQDPISLFPVFAEGARHQWISSVPGGSATNYLEDDRVRDAIRESFGYYQGSPDEVRRRSRKRGDSEVGSRKDVRGLATATLTEVGSTNSLLPTSDLVLPASSDAYVLEKELTRLDFFKKCKTGVPCGEVCLPPGRKCRLRESKFDPRRVSAKLGRGAVAQSIGGLGQDLERAYLRTSRLIKVARRKSSRKQIPLTRKEKIKEALAHEAKLVAVLLGQGTISKTLKTVDEKLIDFSDFAAAAPGKIEDAIADIKESLNKIIKKPTK